MTKPTIIRQGDVLLIHRTTATATPPDWTCAPIGGLGPVLALGEVTGHAHVVLRHPEAYDARDLGQELRAQTRALASALADVGDGLPACQLFRDQAGVDHLVCARHTILRHEEHGPVLLGPGTWEVRRQREWIGQWIQVRD
jgi:hypothetical protein